MSAATDPSVRPDATDAVPSSRVGPSADEPIDVLLPRYARLFMKVGDARGVTIRVRRGGERWHIARAGEGRLDPDDALCERVRLDGSELARGAHYALPVGTIGGVALRLDDPTALSLATRTLLHDLTALLTRETGGGTERAAAAEAARAAAVEVEHQMRNGFAKINAIIDLTAREDMAGSDLTEALKRRVAALGEANEVAIRHGFGMAPLSEVVDAALLAALGRSRGGGVIQACGDTLLISPAVASVLAPIVAELAGDAHARGATDGNHAIRLSWRLDQAQARAVIDWREQGPVTSDPFASAFLRESAPLTLRGEVEVTAPPQGRAEGEATYTLTIPARFVLAP